MTSARTMPDDDTSEPVLEMPGIIIAIIVGACVALVYIVWCHIQCIKWYRSGCHWEWLWTIDSEPAQKPSAAAGVGLATGSVLVQIGAEIGARALSSV